MTEEWIPDQDFYKYYRFQLEIPRSPQQERDFFASILNELDDDPTNEAIMIFGNLVREIVIYMKHHEDHYDLDEDPTTLPIFGGAPGLYAKAMLKAKNIYNKLRKKEAIDEDLKELLVNNPENNTVEYTEEIVTKKTVLGKEYESIKTVTKRLSLYNSQFLESEE